MRLSVPVLQLASAQLKSFADGHWSISEIRSQSMEQKMYSLGLGAAVLQTGTGGHLTV